MTTPPITHPLYAPNRECTACDLRKGCQGPVPGTGPTPTDIMFIGESPGRNEDETGIPFTGPAGQFLDSLLKSIGHNRSSVFVTNTIKCRPPNNRDPLPGEVDECATRWAATEIEMVRPRVLVTMGVFATRWATGLNDGIEHLHGRPLAGITLPYGHTPDYVYPVIHPAAGLHQTRFIRTILSDFEGLKRLVNDIDNVDMADFFVKDEHPHATYRTEKDPLSVYNYLVHAEMLALDTETVDGKLWSVQISKKPGEALFVPADTWRDMERIMGPIPSHVKVVVHNYDYDAQFVQMDNFVDTMLMAYLLGLPMGLKTLARDLCGITMEDYTDIVSPFQDDISVSYLSEVADGEWSPPPPISETKWDNKLGRMNTRTRKPHTITRKAKRILADHMDKGANPYRRWQDIDDLERAEVEEKLGPMPEASLANVPVRQALRYSARDADATLRVYRSLSPLIKEEGLQFVLDHVDGPVLPIVRSMQDGGIGVDPSYFASLSEELGGPMADIADQAADVAGAYLDGEPYRFNPVSGPQVATLVYDKLGFTPTRLTDTGKPSTDDQELKKVDHPVIDLILQYRERAKIKTAYADALPKWVEDDGNGARIHARISAVPGTETGRLRVRNPNVQAIPARTQLGRLVRDGFVTPEGRSFLAMDYSQVEMRLVMALSGCQTGIDLFLEGKDIHTETAASIHGVSVEEAADDKYRYPVMRLGFGVVYGITSHGLFDQMAAEGLADWDLERCDAFINDYYRLYPEVKTFRDGAVDHARQHGYVQDMFGRKRWVPEMSCPVQSIQAAGERQAGNGPIQMGAQGVIKLAMGRIVEKHGWHFVPPSPIPKPAPVQWVMQIHDELMWEMDNGLVHTLATEYARIMESVVQIAVPLEVHASSGPNWGNLEDVPILRDW